MDSIEEYKREIDTGETMSSNTKSTDYDSIESVEAELVAMRDSITEDGLDEAVFAGGVGVHSFPEPDADSPAAGIQTAMLRAFMRATEEIHVDEEMVREYHGEVTPETVAALVESEIENLMGFQVLEDRFLQELRQVLAEE